jgi:TPR repeat protein
VLGIGGFGITYLAHDELGQFFALKEYFPREFATRQDLDVLAASDEEAQLFMDSLDRFRREAQALVRLSRTAGAGDGIVRVVTYFMAHGTGFLVMEYVDGITLAGLLREHPEGLTPARVNSVLSQLLSNVGRVHRADLLHRDIKPANIIVRDDGRVVLIDFGSSRDAAIGRTRTFTQIYSAGFAPLEQMVGLRQGTFSDIYAIGAVCYHAIGGKMVDALTRHIAQSAGKPDPLPPAEQIGLGRYPPPLLKAIDAALVVNPEQRLRNVDAMLALLATDHFDSDTTVAKQQLRPPIRPTPSTARRFRRRHKWFAGILAGALALTSAGYFVPWEALGGWEKAWQEMRRQEASRQEAARQDAARQEAARQEAARQEAARQEAVRQEAATQEAARQEAGRLEAARQDAARLEAARQDAARQEAARQEAAQQEAARQDAARKEAARQEAARQAATQQEAARQDAERQAKANADESTWPEAERRALQTALTRLGQYSGPTDGNVGAMVRSAIRSWQAYEGIAETGRLTTNQRDQILQQAAEQQALLNVPAKSPRGFAADQVRGAEARFNLGIDFEQGVGRAKDPGEAAYWYALAAADGWPPAFNNLGHIYIRGSGVGGANTTAARRLWLTAAALGNPTAMFNLGTLAETGIDGRVDLSLAKRWYTRGADRKDIASIAAMRRLGG